MLRKLMLTLASLALFGALALAQPFVVAPTNTADDGWDDHDIGTGQAVVNQTVTLKVPQATALHLDVTDLVFDLSELGGSGAESSAGIISTPDFAPDMTCVYGLEEDITINDGPWGQTMTAPLGTYYKLASTGWPNIEVIGWTTEAGVTDVRAVNSYPPIEIGEDHELVEGSKNHFVCYRSFILQKFSNGKTWDLTVKRTDDAARSGALQHIYIQDNPCHNAVDWDVTGFYELATDASIHLVPQSLGTGPTGSRAAEHSDVCGVKSWLDDLVVVAVKVNADYDGDNVATLEYTLTTTEFWNIGAEASQ